MVDWSKLKVTELKDELRSRGIALTGLKLKADFVAKLEEVDTIVDTNIPERQVEDQGARENAVSEPEPQPQIVDAHDEPAEVEENASGEKISDQEGVAPPAEDAPAIEEVPDEQANNATLPEMVDMYSASQIKPTPSQPLTDILAVKQDPTFPSETKPRTPPLVERDHTSSLSTPMLGTELVEDSKKRKRRSATPPPNTQDLALKKVKASDGTPAIKKQDSSLEKIQAATDAAEAIQAPNGLADDDPIKHDMPGPMHSTHIKPSLSVEHATGNGQAPLQSLSPKHGRESTILSDDRNVQPALHPATRSLYLRNFKRPLQVATLRSHINAVAQSPATTSPEDFVALFHLDNIRTHAFVSLDSIATAARVRSAMHQTVFPDEVSRTPIWVDFVPDEEIETWIARETSSSDRNRKWEVVYNGTSNGIIAVHQEVDASSSPQKLSSGQPRHISLSEASSQAPAPTGPSIHPDRATLVPRPERASYDRVMSSRPDPKPPIVPSSDTGTGFRALDELFSSTTTKPKLYFKTVPTSIAEDRLGMIRRLRIGHSEMGRSGDEGMKRYSFEVYKGHEEWVDKGPEFGYGRRGVDALEGRRGRGGLYRLSRGGDRPRGGDSWRGRY